jgi:hypothetical protein
MMEVLDPTHGDEGAEVVRVTKPNYSAPAGADVFDAAREWQAIVAGVGD